MFTVNKYLGRFTPGQACAYGHTGTQTFSQAHDIRHNRRVLVSKPSAGPTYARLHFINHEQPAVGIANLPQSFQIGAAVLRYIDAAFALHRLNQYGHHVRVAAGHLLDRIDVIVRHTYKTADQGFKTSLHFAIAGC